MRKFPIREVARVVVLDRIGNVLLVRYQDDEPLDPEREGPLSYWVPPGGALEPGESYRSAARRELEEECGLLPEIGPAIWEVEHRLRSQGQLVNQRERYFIGRVDAVHPAVANRTAEAILEHRWWTLTELQESSEEFFPRGFINLVEPIVGGAIPSKPIRI
jgi:8-oxo-dGTP diphosphatase